jgi:hypothetical protein
MNFYGGPGFPYGVFTYTPKIPFSNNVEDLGMENVGICI